MSKRICTSAGVIQRENFTSAPGSSSSIPGLLVQLADRGRAVGVVAVALAGVDGAAREHPHAAHEARLRRAPDQQHLERSAPPRSRITVAAWRGGVAGPGLYSSPGPGPRCPWLPSPRVLIG